MQAKKKKKHPRGWLMVEVAIGGVMASVIVGALLVNVGDAMDKSTVIGRELTANMLAQQAIEMARAVDRTTLASGPVAVPSGLAGTYTRNQTVTQNAVCATVNTITISCTDVVVTVTFPLVDGTTKSFTLETQIFN
jgi:type II secretory pathway pseudopilin PulG